MKKILFILCSFMLFNIHAQEPGGPEVDAVYFRDKVTNAIMNGYTPDTGKYPMVWNTTQSKLFQWDGNSWEQVSGASSGDDQNITGGIYNKTAETLIVTIEDGTSTAIDLSDIATNDELDNQMAANNEAAEHGFTPNGSISSNSTQEAVQEVRDEAISKTDIVDDDVFATVSATTVPSSKSVKAYVDANSGSSATNLNGATDVNIIAPSQHEALIYDGASWANQQIHATHTQLDSDNGSFTASNLQDGLEEVRDESINKYGVNTAGSTANYSFQDAISMTLGGESQTKIRSKTGLVVTIPIEFNNGNITKNLILNSDGTATYDGASLIGGSGGSSTPVGYTFQPITTNNQILAPASNIKTWFKIEADTVKLNNTAPLGLPYVTHASQQDSVVVMLNDTIYKADIDGTSIAFKDENAIGFKMRGGTKATVIREANNEYIVTGDATPIFAAPLPPPPSNVTTLYTEATAANPNNEVNAAPAFHVESGGMTIASVADTEHGAYALEITRTAATGSTIWNSINLGDLTSGQSRTVAISVKEVTGDGWQLMQSSSQGWVTSNFYSVDSSVWTVLTFPANDASGNLQRLRIRSLSTETTANAKLRIDYFIIN